MTRETSELTLWTCDTCKKQATTKEDDDNVIPKGWFTLERLEVSHQPTKGEEKNLYLDNCDDPDFCSKKCLMEFLTKKINKI